MVFELALSEPEMSALQRQAAKERCSAEQVAKWAILDRISRSDRSQLIRKITEEVLERHAVALKMLAD